MPRHPLPFTSSGRSSVGLEWELALVDRQTRDLRHVAPHVIDAVRPSDGEEHPHIRGELLTNTVEVVSGVSQTVAQASADLDKALDQVRALVDPLDVDLTSAGTHPFARWDEQLVTDKQRYSTLIDRTQWWGRQMLIFGTHVHVGIDDRSKVMPISRALVSVFAHLQSLSASSPFWLGSDTGYASHRALMFQQLPTAGLPQPFDRWEQFEEYVADMLHVGVIDTVDEIRWDVRPSPRFGTLEIRICDASPTLQEVAAFGALVHCLVEHFSTLLDQGVPLPALQQWFVIENKWRSARYGTDAIIITNAAGDEALVTDEVSALLETLAPTAERLGCTAELAGIREVLRLGASYQRQRAVAAAHDGDLRAVVESLVAETTAGRPLMVPPAARSW